MVQVRLRALREAPKTAITLLMSTVRTNAAAEMLGVSPNTLRSWERRFGYPKPRRTQGGHRQFELVQIEALRQAFAETHNISSAIALARERGEGPSTSARQPLKTMSPECSSTRMVCDVVWAGEVTTVSRLASASIEFHCERSPVEKSPLQSTDARAADDARATATRASTTGQRALLRKGRDIELLSTPNTAIAITSAPTLRARCVTPACAGEQPLPVPARRRRWKASASLSRIRTLPR